VIFFDSERHECIKPRNITQECIATPLTFINGKKKKWILFLYALSFRSVTVLFLFPVLPAGNYADNILHTAKERLLNAHEQIDAA